MGEISVLLRCVGIFSVEAFVTKVFTYFASHRAAEQAGAIGPDEAN